MCICMEMMSCCGEYGRASCSGLVFYLTLVYEGEGKWKTTCQKFSVRERDQDEGQENIGRQTGTNVHC